MDKENYLTKLNKKVSQFYYKNITKARDITSKALNFSVAFAAGTQIMPLATSTGSNPAIATLTAMSSFGATLIGTYIAMRKINPMKDLNNSMLFKLHEKEMIAPLSKGHIRQRVKNHEKGFENFVYGKPVFNDLWSHTIINARNGVIFGPTGSGKSFWLNGFIDIALTKGIHKTDDFIITLVPRKKEIFNNSYIDVITSKNYHISNQTIPKNTTITLLFTIKGSRMHFTTKSFYYNGKKINVNLDAIELDNQKGIKLTLNELKKIEYILSNEEPVIFPTNYQLKLKCTYL